MRVNANGSQLSCLALAAALALLAGAPDRARADRPTRDTLTPATWHLTYNKGPEIELLSSPPQVQVSLEGPSTHGGVTPFTVPGNLRGRYVLEAHKAGFVYAAECLEFVREDLQAPTSAPIVASRSPLLAAALPPGVAEWRSGYALQGLALGGSEVAAALGYVWAHERRTDAASALASLSDQANAANGDVRERLEVESQYAAARERAWRRAEQEWLGFGGGLWVLTALMRTSFAPELETSFDADGRLALELEPVRTSSVALRSAILPGWGQLYSGRLRLGQGFMLGSLSSIMGFLLADQAYVRAEADLVRADRYLEYIRKIDAEATAAAMAQLEHARRVADQAWSTRTLTLGLTAGIWAYNLFDAVMHARGPDPDDASPRVAPDAVPDEAPQEGPSLSALPPLGGRFGIEVRF